METCPNYASVADRYRTSNHEETITFQHAGNNHVAIHKLTRSRDQFNTMPPCSFKQYDIYIAGTKRRVCQVELCTDNVTGEWLPYQVKPNAGYEVCESLTEYLMANPKVVKLPFIAAQEA